MGPKAKEILVTLLKKIRPDQWKVSIVIPILKKSKDPSNFDNYRPISLTSMLANLMERMVNTRLTWFLENNNILGNEQAGFRPQRSTNQQVVTLSQHFKDVLDARNTLTAVRDVGESLSITYIPSVEKLKDRLIQQRSVDSDLPEAILLPDFTSPSEIKSLQFSKVSIYGLPSLYSLRFGDRHWTKHKPVFSFAMADAIVTITGFRDYDVVNHIATLINWMGGSVRRKLDPTVTHLIAYRCAGEKVRKAALTSANVTTMKLSWVQEAWDSRHSNPQLNACGDDFIDKHRAKVFQSCCLYFIGFSNQPKTLVELESAVVDHDGTLATDLSDEKLTHVVVADGWHKSEQNIDMRALIVSPNSSAVANSPHSNSFALDPELQEQLHEVAVRVPVLKLDWFWKSLQSTYICPPQDYYYIPEPEPKDSPYASYFSQRTSLDICSPASYRLSLEILDKENKQPILECSEGNNSHLTSTSDAEVSVRLRQNRSNEHQLSREEVIAHLADPLLVPNSGNSSRIYSRNRASFTLLDNPSPLSASVQNCSTPASESKRRPLSIDCLEEKATRSPVQRIPLESIKSSIENSPKRFRSSPARSEIKTPQKSRLKDREHRVFEFFVTEKNYSSILEFLTQSALPDVLMENQEGGPILPRQEADMVFGKLIPIYQLHKRLQAQLTELEASWNMETSRLGEILLPLIDEMEKVYTHYMQFYDEPHIKQLAHDYPRFLAFMRQVELRREYGRQSICDLLIRPVQRLPSILLLMQGIQKFTPPTHPDYEDVVAFTAKLNTLLEKINARLKKTEEYMSLLNLYHDISGAPPEIVSASRNLVTSLSVFQLDISPNGTAVCEPVIIFLLTDCLEIVRTKKRTTGDNHAIQAALAAVESGTLATADATGTESSLGVEKRGKSVSRTNSGASAGSSTIGGKKRYKYVHVHFVKLQDITRVLDLSTLSPERAAFSLIIRDASSEAEKAEEVLTFCLAASFTASAAVATGKCPEAIESAVASANLSVIRPTVLKCGTSVSAVDFEASALATSTLAEAEIDDLSVVNGEQDCDSTVAKLRYCVHEQKMNFLKCLCKYIMQVSFVANSPDEILVEMQPDLVLNFDLDSVFSHTVNVSFKTKKFSRHLGRAISLKTPHRPILKSVQPVAPPASISNPKSFRAQNGLLRNSTTQGSNEPPSPNLSYRSDSIDMPPPSRPSVLGSIFGGLLSHGIRTPKHSMRGLSMTELDAEMGGTMSAKRKTQTSSLWLEFDLDTEDCDNSVADNREEEEGGGGCDSNVEGEDEDDLISLNSYNSAGGPWPAFLPSGSPGSKKSKKMLNPATASSTSLRSNSSRRLSTGKSRQSFGGLMSATRKSICRSFLGIHKAPKEVQPPAAKQYPHPDLSSSSFQPSTTVEDKQRQKQLQVSGAISESNLSLSAAPLARQEDISNDSVEGEGKEKETTIVNEEENNSIPRQPSFQAPGASTTSNARLNSPGPGQLDKSSSETRLTFSGKNSRANTLKRMLTSPFRKPSTAASSNGAGRDLKTSSPESITSWSSLITLNEENNEDEDIETEHERLAEMITARHQGQRVSGDDTCSMIVPQAPPLISALKKFRSKRKEKKHFRRSYGSEIFNRATGLDEEKKQKLEELSVLPTVPESLEAALTPDVSRLEENEDNEQGDSELHYIAATRRERLFSEIEASTAKVYVLTRHCYAIFVSEIGGENSGEHIVIGTICLNVDSAHESRKHE
nr:protein ect2 [Hymenolepis microstoma]